MARYRNDVNVPLNYGERGPWVEPGGEFSTEEYPGISPEQLESHLKSGFISVVGALVEEAPVHQTRKVVDHVKTATRRRSPLDE